MKTRVMCDLVTSDQADSDLFRNTLLLELTGMDTFEKSVDLGQGEKDWNVSGDVRFNKPLEAVAWYNLLVAKLRDPLQVKLLTASHAHMHNCPHDDPKENYHCREDPRAAFQEQIK